MNRSVLHEQFAARPDPILVEVIYNQVLGLAEEMGLTLMRAAYSPNIKQRADCSTAVLGLDGSVYAQAPRIPIHLGSMTGTVTRLLVDHPLETMRDGDMYLANDPYSGGGQHLPDINVITPVFHEGRPVAFVANIAHHADVGGMLPGSEAVVCRSIFQEGLRLPPIQVVREGEILADIISLIALNSRTPEERRGDLLAQIAANRVGSMRFKSCLEKHGGAVIEQALRFYIDATERQFSDALEAIADHVVEVEDFLDPDIYGSGEPVKVRLRLEKKGNRLLLDFEGTGKQFISARNVPVGALQSTVYTVVKMLIDPGLAANSGYFRLIEITAPEGSLLNPGTGAPVSARALPCAVIGDVVARALSGIVPESAIAGGGPHHQVIFSGADSFGRTWVNYETFAGAQGARPYKDGIDGVRIHASGSSNLPIEALEQNYPLRITNYSLRDGSGGRGRFRGGMGIVRDYEILDDMVISLAAERQITPAAGAAGGGNGACGAFILNPGTENEEKLASAVGDFALRQGDVLSVRTPGGGGYGVA